MSGNMDPDVARSTVDAYVRAHRTTKAEVALDAAGGDPNKVGASSPLLRGLAVGIARGRALAPGEHAAAPFTESDALPEPMIEAQTEGEQ